MSDMNAISWPGWEIVRKIGSGSFGSVYEIQRDVFGDIERAALKVITIPQSRSDIDELLNEGYDEASVTERFRGYLQDIAKEYSLMAKMKGHTNVVYCDDIRYVQHDDGIGWDIYIKMELLSPMMTTLSSDIPEETAIRVGMDICSALVLCRQQNIVHRDIKPQNIFVSANGEYKLGDFGIAKTAEKTTGGTKIGTYKYMAPEVYNNQPYGAAADIYSLGIVLYWLLNARRTPFLPLPPQTPSASMEEEARRRRFAGEPLPPPAYGSPELKAIVLKACAYDTRERYASPDEMLADLKALSSGEKAAVPSFKSSPVIQPLSNDERTISTFNHCSAQTAEATVGAFDERYAAKNVEATVGQWSAAPSQTMPKREPVQTAPVAEKPMQTKWEETKNEEPKAEATVGAFSTKYVAKDAEATVGQWSAVPSRTMPKKEPVQPAPAAERPVQPQKEEPKKVAPMAEITKPAAPEISELKKAPEGKKKTWILFAGIGAAVLAIVLVLVLLLSGGDDKPEGTVSGDAGSHSSQSGKDDDSQNNTAQSGYVAIYNVANGKVMTTSPSVFTDDDGTTKDQWLSTTATLIDGMLTCNSGNVALFKMETDNNGITTFCTVDGKYLEADSKNIRFVAEENENTQFVLEETEGGYYIRLANCTYTDVDGTELIQYIDLYQDTFTVYSMTADSSLYIFNFYELSPESSRIENTEIVGGEDLFRGERFPEMLWGYYEADCYDYSGSSDDANVFLEDMTYIQVAQDDMVYEFAALPLSIQSGRYSHFMESVYYEDTFYEPYTEKGKAVFRKVFIEAVGDLTEEQFQNIETLMQLQVAELLVVDRTGRASYIWCAYKIENGKLAFYSFSVDDQYHVTLDNAPLVTYDFLMDGSKLALMTNGVQRDYVASGYKPDDPSLHFSGYALNDQNCYGDIDGFSFYQYGADDEPSVYVNLSNGDSPVDAVITFDSKTGEFTLSWTERWTTYNGYTIREEDVFSVSGKIVPCTTYPSDGHGGMFLFIDGKRYDYLMSNAAYEELQYSNILGEGVNVEDLTTSDLDNINATKNSILEDLSAAFEAAGIDAEIDPNSGKVTLESSFLFATNSAELSAEGQAYLNGVLDVYSAVVMSDAYSGYIAGIVIEGHTDIAGSYSSNLILSEQRAASVANHCLDRNPTLASVIQTKGCSYDYPIYNDDGSVNMDKSRRVTFRFILEVG